jgi:hypothetical protein
MQATAESLGAAPGKVTPEPSSQSELSATYPAGCGVVGRRAGEGDPRAVVAVGAVRDVPCRLRAGGLRAAGIAVAVAVAVGVPDRVGAGGGIRIVAVGPRVDADGR